MKHIPKLLVLILLLATETVGAQTLRFAKGDRVAFIGDSITHGGTYHSDAYLFYALRFPDQPFDCFNCGISGDTTPGTNLRFQEDIAIHRPTVATIMLGMNDGWEGCYGEEPVSDDVRKQREIARRRYTDEMRKLIASLQGIGARVILITPSIYDETAEVPIAPNIGRNPLLGSFAEALEQLAKESGASVIDFHGPMTELNAKLQEADPIATIVGPDRVHPGPPGHLVMTWLLLKAQDVSGFVSAIQLDAANQQVVLQDNCVVSDVTFQQDVDTIRFSCLESGLPFPVSKAQQPALEWVSFQQDFKQQTIRINGLKPGDYELSIDDTIVGVWSSDQFSAGINLSDNAKTPQYQQALIVQAANRKRLAAIDKLRAIMHVRHSMIRKLKPPVDEANVPQMKLALDEHAEESNGKSWYEYLKGQIEKYFEALPQESELSDQEQHYRQQMWQLSQPVPHRWIIVRLRDGEN